MPFYKSILAVFIIISANQFAFANDRYTYSTNSTEVTDASTGLTWRRCSEGQIFRDDRCAGKATEVNFKGALAQAKKQANRDAKWRVPTLQELETLVIKSAKPAVIDNQVFPDTVANRYWTSTVHETEKTQALIVLFKDGHVFKYHRNNKAHVRLVRN